MCDYRKKNPKPFKKREIKTGMYVKLVMKTADLWERLQGKKAITYSWYKVVSIRDGIMVKRIAKSHKRSKPNPGSAWLMELSPEHCFANKIWDVAKDRNEMIVKRDAPGYWTYKN